MGDALIELRDVSKVYGEGDATVRALDHVTLAIRTGEFVAIMGASGCGKSTLLHILGCLDRPTSGSYQLAGRELTTASEPELAALRATEIGFVFQSFNLLPRTSALENVSLPLVYAASREDPTPRALAVLAEVGLTGRSGNRPNQLSGGQQQRVAIARALVNRPSLLLADEPTGNLDSKSAREIATMLARLNREHGLTVVLVTHDAEVATFARRVVVMRDGAILSDTGRAAEAEEPPVSAPPTARPAAPGALAAFLPTAARASLVAIRRNPLRSALTLIGIVIGVASLIAMVSIGMGVHAAVTEQIDRLGANLIVIQSGASVASGARGAAGSSSTLFVEDAQAILHEAPSVRDVGYLIKSAGQASYLDRNWNTTVQGASAGLLRIQAFELEAGRQIEPAEQAEAARVCVLGQTVYKNLFAAGESPIGATILVRNVPLEVVGLLREMGQTGTGRDQDDLVLIPFATARSKVIGDAAAAPAGSQRRGLDQGVANPFQIAPHLGGRVQSIFVQADKASGVATVIRDITEILRARHHIVPDEPPDFDVKNLSLAAEARERTSVLLGRLLAAVASITLLVGGIGIMNIMLVSVTERTREIGIRLAVGARRTHILIQFLMESVALSVSGGVLGALLGVSFSFGTARLAGWPALLSAEALAGGVMFSAAVGIAFGWYPARRASRLRPIEALRYE